MKAHDVKKKSLKSILKKYTGKGGPTDSSYSQAKSPINLLSSDSNPPTVSPIPKSKANPLEGK